LYGLLEQLVVRYSTDNHPSWFGLARGGGNGWTGQMNWGEVVGYDGFQVGLENRFGVKFTFQLLRFVLVSMHSGLVVKDRLKKICNIFKLFWYISNLLQYWPCTVSSLNLCFCFLHASTRDTLEMSRCDGVVLRQLQLHLSFVRISSMMITQNWCCDIFTVFCATSVSLFFF